MPESIFRKSFAGNFTGINAESSALEDDTNDFARLVNYEWAVSNNIRGRCGSQIISQSVAGALTVFTHSFPRVINQYTEKFQATSPGISGTKASADGSTVQQNLQVGVDQWRLESYNISIVVVSGSNVVSWYATVGANGNIHFILTQGGATYLDYDCGNQSSTSTTFYSLLQAIDATANFSVSFARSNCPPIALVNGSQIPTGAVFTDNGLDHYGTGKRTLTVTSGHTFLPGDYIILPGAGGQAGYVISTTATTIVFLPGRSYAQITLANGAIVGALGNLAQCFPIDVIQSTTSSPFNINFPFYRPVGNIFGIINSTNSASNNTYSLPSTVSLNGNCYITLRVGGTPALPLFKYDGQMVTAAGLPKPDVSVSSIGTGLTGTYRYRAFYRRIDAQGNITEGTPSAAKSFSFSNQSGLIGISAITYQSTDTRYQYIVNSAFSAEAKVAFSGGATTLKVDNSNTSAGYLQIGDPICFNESTTSTLVRSIVTSVDGSVSPMTITMETLSSAVSMADNTSISAGLSIVILRTTASGTIWYELTEIANNPFGSGTVNFTDAVSDATLSGLAVFTDPDVGKEHDPVTDCSYVCGHQGGLVTAGGITQPNTVNFSSADGIEYFPLASNNFDIPSTRAGSITAIASDTTDRPAVFKYDSYYDVSGDLDGGQFSVNVINEGDFGITSMNSLTRVRGALIGLSKFGFVTILNGVLDDQAFRGINARIVNQPWLLNYASACNDIFTKTYICSIPTRTGTYNTFILDYSRNITVPFERSYTSFMVPQSFSVYGDSLYSFTNGSFISRRLYRFNGDSPTGNDGDTFIDHTAAIPYILETQSINLGEPSVWKTPIRLRIYSIPNDYIVEGWVPFSMLVEAGIFPDPSFVGSANPGGLTSTLTFSGITNWYEDVKLPSAKCLAYLIRFTTNTIRQSPFFCVF